MNIFRRPLMFSSSSRRQVPIFRGDKANDEILEMATKFDEMTMTFLETTTTLIEMTTLFLKMTTALFLKLRRNLLK